MNSYPNYDDQAAYGQYEAAQPQAGLYDQQAGAQEAAVVDAPARWSWSCYPTNRIDGARMVVPLGCVYSPLSCFCAAALPYEPVSCLGCGGIMNPFATMHGGAASWGCPLCGKANSVPPQYARMSAAQMPAELMRGYETVEYVVSAPQRRAPTFVLVADVCVDTEEELQGLREVLLMVLDRLPAQCYVSLITFGATVEVHDLTGTTPYPRSIALRGVQEVTATSLAAAMGDPHRYVVPHQHARQTVEALLASMTKDVWPVPRDSRPLRSTGAALSTAASLLEIVSPSSGCCILTFLSGACTSGPGIVVNQSREHMIRGHSDIRDGTATATHWRTSVDYYDRLMQRIVKQGHSLNCIIASLDQVGVAEMKMCLQASGGTVLNAESWLQEPLRLSLEQFLACGENGALQVGLNATMDVLTSPTWKVLGVIGPCVGTGKKSTSVGEYEIGFGGTCQWTTCIMDAYTSFAIYFDSANGASALPGGTDGSTFRYVQFITKYEVGNEQRTRVTTIAHRQVANPPKQELIASFDQETAVVLLARQAVHKTDSLPLFDVLRWIDRMVVRLVSQFGEYTRNQPGSLRLPPSFAFFPAFVYHLRRSGYLQVFNSSPDESAILRLQLLKSSVADSIVQIQPTLYRYRMDDAPQPVPLDSEAMQPDCVLLLDTFFEVLVHSGATIAAWRRAGYADLPEYAHFREFLEVPLSDAQLLVSSRFPMPRLIDVCQDDPDARILYNRLNPSRSYANEEANQYGSQAGELVYTDDASLQTFTEHLKKLVVAQ